ncbi:MAG: hypothetical protein HYS81_05080 [Candidatus Aenigmatarchaeota archaeon]|nr:MAG: hypothetical protein HYS81_05080 [Candidatus Aenigmarchaeota archaeon]
MEALLYNRSGSPAPCDFCGTPISDLGLGFHDHIKTSEGCSAQYEAWLERIKQDHPEGD